MNTLKSNKRLTEEGFLIIENVFSGTEVEKILHTIALFANEPKFRETFAIRNFFKEFPKTIQFILSKKLKKIISSLFGEAYFIVKSIYFDKPPSSNWFVSRHQDLMISVDKKIEVEAYSHWTIRQNRYAVQPPVSILEKNFTVRVHLDHADENNGALRITPGSHLKGIYRTETGERHEEKEVVCKIEKGGIMIMRPLLMHSSKRSSTGGNRRVIHLEFSNVMLPQDLQWSEYLPVFL